MPLLLQNLILFFLAVLHVIEILKEEAPGMMQTVNWFLIGF
jgi:hypothetical protein